MDTDTGFGIGANIFVDVTLGSRKLWWAFYWNCIEWAFNQVIEKINRLIKIEKRKSGADLLRNRNLHVRNQQSSLLNEYTGACDSYKGILRLLNLDSTPNIFSTISRQLATNVLIHLLVPLCFLNDVPQPLKLIEVKKEVEERKQKKNVLLDWSCVRWGKISLKYNLGFLRCTIHKQFKGPYFWDMDRRVHTQILSSLANIKDYISVPATFPSSVPALFPCLILSRSLICQPTMFDYNTNGHLRDSSLSVSRLPVAEIDF